MLSSYHNKQTDRQKQVEDTLSSHGCVSGLDGGGGFMRVYLSPDSSSCTHSLRTNFDISIIAP